ncbi:MAG: ribulose-phosphate 3-epimerase [Candidatus Paceibacterota bacterium]
MAEVIPSILVKTKEELLEKISAVEAFVGRVHLDIADGIFVPNTTIGGFNDIRMIETELKIGVHLMVSKPENHISHWLGTPADRFIFHVEATSRWQEVIDIAKENDKEIGVALNPKTPTSSIESFVDQVDFVHFMTVEPGFYGSKFEESVVAKIADFHFYYPDKPILVDGGVTPETAPKLVEAGATMLVSGSYIFKSKDIETAIRELEDAAN